MRTATWTMTSTSSSLSLAWQGQLDSGRYSGDPSYCNVMYMPCSVPLSLDHLVVQVVEVSASRAEDPEFDSHLRCGDFFGLSHTSDLKIGTPVATLSGAWGYRVSAGTVWPGVSILWLGEIESLICNFYLSVAAHTIVWADPWDTLACCWSIKQPTHYKYPSLVLFAKERETEIEKERGGGGDSLRTERERECLYVCVRERQRGGGGLVAPGQHTWKRFKALSHVGRGVGGSG